MPRSAEPTLSYEPLEQAVRDRVHPETLAFYGASLIGRLCDASPRSVYRWQRHGVSVYAADVAASRLGRHPVLVWGSEWIEAMAAMDELGRDPRTHGTLPARVKGVDAA